MKIKKIAQSIGVLGKILNTKSTSQENTYSCDYLNNKFDSKGNSVSTSRHFGSPTISTNSTTLENIGVAPTNLTVNNDDSTVIIFAKVGGLYNSSNSYGIVFDVNMDKTTFSSSGSKSIASANLRGNWSTDGTLKCEFIDMFIFKNVPKGEHNFYMYWATNDSSATAYSGYYAGISMTAIEL